MEVKKSAGSATSLLGLAGRAEVRSGIFPLWMIVMMVMVMVVSFLV